MAGCYPEALAELVAVAPYIDTRIRYGQTTMLSIPPTPSIDERWPADLTKWTRVRLAVLFELEPFMTTPTTAADFTDRCATLARLKVTKVFRTPPEWVAQAVVTIDKEFEETPTPVRVRTLVWGEKARSSYNYIRGKPGAAFGPWVDCDIIDVIERWRATRLKQGYVPPSFCPAREPTMEHLKQASKVLGHVPFTCLDKNAGDTYPVPGRQLMRFLCGQKDDRLRSAMILIAVIMAAKRTKQLGIASVLYALHKIVNELAVARPDWDFLGDEPDEVFKQLLDGRIVPHASEQMRLRGPVRWTEAARVFERYQECLAPDDRKRLFRFSIKYMKDTLYWRNQKITRIRNQAARKRRKDKVDRLQTDFASLRFIAEIRTNIVRRLSEATDEAMARVRAERLPLPYDFSYVDVVHYEDRRSAVRQKVHLRLHSEGSLRRLGDMGKKRGFIEYVEPLDVVQLLSIEPESPGGPVDEFWFVPLFRAQVLSDRDKYVPEVARRQAALWKEAGLPGPASLKLPQWFAGAVGGSRHVSIAHVAFAAIDHGAELLFPRGILGTCLYARAMIRVQTVSGARVGEILQVAAAAEYLKFERLPVGKKGSHKDIYSFKAVPKGHTEVAEYFIDKQTMEAILEVADFVRQRDGLAAKAPLPMARSYSEARELPDNRYVFQVPGRSLESNEANGLYRFILWGLQSNIETHTIRHAVANLLDRLGVAEPIIATMLKQKDLTATRYYKEPTRSQVMTAAEFLFRPQVDWSDTVTVGQRLGAERSAQVLEQIQAAGDLSGAFTQVVGGPCVVSHACAAKFSCINCVGKIPDPAKRPQVEGKLRDAERIFKLAELQDLPAEARKARGAINDCKAELHEMDLIERAMESRKGQ